MKFVKRHLLSQKSLYFVLIAGGALISIYFWIQIARVFLGNYALNEQSPAKICRWKVEEVDSDRYLLSANFLFDAAGQRFSGQTRFDRPSYLNPDSAIQALKEKIAHPEPWMAWFDADDPNRSTLEKKPFWGLLFRAALSTAVLIHFLLLRTKWFRSCQI